MINAIELIVGAAGVAAATWIACEKYLTLLYTKQALLQLEQQNALLNRHEFQDLFENNPHPELFDEQGNLNQGEYVVINFPPNFDPETEGWFVEDPDEDNMW